MKGFCMRNFKEMKVMFNRIYKEDYKPYDEEV